MQAPPHLAGQSTGLTDGPSVRVHSEVVTIAGDDYVRETIYVGGEATRVEYPFAAFAKASREASPWLTMAVQISAIATTSTVAGYLIGSLFA